MQLEQHFHIEFPGSIKTAAALQLLREFFFALKQLDEIIVASFYYLEGEYFLTHKLMALRVNGQQNNRYLFDSP
jgi:hypothetical protein